MKLKLKWWQRFLPRSAFSQTVLLIGSLLLINQLVSYWSVAVYFIKPSYEQINQLIARQINILFVDGVDVGREHLTMVDALNATRSRTRPSHLLQFLVRTNVGLPWRRSRSAFFAR